MQTQLMEIAYDLAPFDLSSSLQNLRFLDDESKFYWTHLDPRGWKYKLFGVNFKCGVECYIVTIVFGLM